MAADHAGKEIWVLTDEGRYHGTIQSVDGKNRKLILERVSMANGTRLRGLQTFFTNEIRDLQLLDDGKDEKSSTCSSTEGRLEEAQLEDPENDSVEPESTLSAKDPSDEGSRLIPRKPLVPSKYLTGDDSFIATSSDDEFIDIPDVILVDELDEKYDKALDHINEQRVVGLAAEGNPVGRSGALCLLVVGCRGVTYIFDVHKLGEEGFSKGLSAFLENRYILKVVHDCRLISDCLFNFYKTVLKNIFDTQVGDIIIYKQKRGKLPIEVNGLEPCLYEYLNLKPSKCTFSSVIARFTKLDSNLWETRPLQPELLNAVAQKVMFLRELRVSQMENMLAEFLFGVDIYLEVFRDSPEDYSKAPAKTRRVPGEFQRLQTFTKRRWKRYEDKDKQMSGHDDFSFGKQNEWNFSYKDQGGWTEGNQFADMYRKKHGKIIERDDITREQRPSHHHDRIDPRNAPWKSVKLESEDKDALERQKDDIVLRCESVVREPRKKEVKTNINSGTENTSWGDEESKKDANGYSASVKKRSENLDLKETALESAREEIRTPHESHERKTEDEKVSGFLNQTHNYNNNYLEPRNMQKETLLAAVQRKKPPVDWFDCDTPSTDRSRSSSIDSEESAKHILGQSDNSKTHGENGQITRYNEEYPPLSPDSPGRQTSSPDRHKTSPGRSPLVSTINASSAKRDLSGLLGVKGAGSRPIAVGRARSRDYFASSKSPLRASPGSAQKTDRLQGTHAFPPDDDLLHTDPIVRANPNLPIQGQKIKVQRITTR